MGVRVFERLQGWREWFPVPQQSGRLWVDRWILLEGNRNAVSFTLLLLVFAFLIGLGEVYTLEMRRLLTETGTVQTILNTLMSGIILLVSIVVSINSIVLSHDITSLQDQEERIDGVMRFRDELGELAEGHEKPNDPGSFLSVMAEVIQDRTDALTDVAEGADEEFAEEIKEYVDRTTETARKLSDPGSGGAEFNVIWLGLNVDYSNHMDKSRTLKSSYADSSSEDFEERLDDLIKAFQLFATGKEYFKTLYYTEEVSQLSRTLLVVSLPAILVNASVILAISAGLLPDVWILGLPPLMSFVAAAFTVSLAPFIVLTAYTLRLATVARYTAATGPFSLQR
jgi:hypothetical protein